MNLQTQSFIIEPNGMIKGGTATYSANLETGNINYSAAIKAGFLFFTKEFQTSGVYKTDPSQLRSEMFYNGKTTEIGELRFSVTRAIVGSSQIAFAVIGDSKAVLAGSAELDTLEEFAFITSVSSHGKVAGKDVILNLRLTSEREFRPPGFLLSTVREAKQILRELAEVWPRKSTK